MQSHDYIFDDTILRKMYEHLFYLISNLILNFVPFAYNDFEH